MTIAACTKAFTRAGPQATRQVTRGARPLAPTAKNKQSGSSTTCRTSQQQESMRRYQRDLPGGLVRVDISTRLLYSEVHDNKQAGTAFGFRHRAFNRFASHGVQVGPRSTASRPAGPR